MLYLVISSMVFFTYLFFCNLRYSKVLNCKIMLLYKINFNIINVIARIINFIELIELVKKLLSTYLGAILVLLLLYLLYSNKNNINQIRELNVLTDQNKKILNLDSFKIEVFVKKCSI